MRIPRFLGLRLSDISISFFGSPPVDAGPSGPSIKNSETPHGRGLDRRFTRCNVSLCWHIPAVRRDRGWVDKKTVAAAWAVGYERLCVDRSRRGRRASAAVGVGSATSLATPSPWLAR